MANYFADDPDYETDLQAAYEVIGLPDWWNDTEQDDIKLVALYRLLLIEKAVDRAINLLEIKTEEG